MTSDRSAQTPIGKTPINKTPAGDTAADATTATTSDALATAAQRAHAQSLEHLSPRVRAQLALRRRDALAPARRAQRARWWPALAAGSVAVMALAIGLRLQLPPEPPPGDTAADLAAIVADLETPAPPAAHNGNRGAAGFDSLDDDTLDESPDLYLWLASDEADVLTEETP